MAVPNSRSTLITYVKRRLGDPVIELNLDDDQISDRIDDALQRYQDYHTDAVEKVYLKHQVTASDISNKYISTTTVGDLITGVVNVFPITDSNYGTVNMFDMRYQIRLNDLYDFSDVSMLHYVMVHNHLELINDTLVGQVPFDWTRHQDKLYIHMDWANDIEADEYLVIECYRILDPEVATSIYNDHWLKRYATELVRRQWGENLSKFDGIQLPGGLTYNGTAMLERAIAEIEKLETEMDLNYGGILPILTG
tara:strand:- start:1905 stop:2660 length:756 start_codon:yes stop_codon:yes gene_type:complete